MIEAPLWTAPFATQPAEPAAVPQRADVAILGAGYTGLSAALELCRSGLTAVVLEAHHVGAGASSRNGGMVLTGLKEGPGALVRRYGEKGARAFFDASLRALELVERLVQAERIDCGYARCGHIELACTPRHAAGFVRAQGLLERVFGHRVRVLSRAELAGEIGSTVYAGGLLDERSGGLDPCRYVRGLADAARRAGAVVAEETPASAIERDGSGWRVQTPRGDVACANVLVATGAYGGTEFPLLRRRLVPLGSYVIATEPLPGDLARDLIARNRMRFDSKRMLHYFRLTPDSRMLFGGRAAFVAPDAQTTRQSAECCTATWSQRFRTARCEGGVRLGRLH